VGCREEHAEVFWDLGDAADASADPNPLPQCRCPDARLPCEPLEPAVHFHQPAAVQHVPFECDREQWFDSTRTSGDEAERSGGRNRDSRRIPDWRSTTLRIATPPEIRIGSACGS
jgi:hypothetical protein